MFIQFQPHPIFKSTCTLHSTVTSTNGHPIHILHATSHTATFLTPPTPLPLPIIAPNAQSAFISQPHTLPLTPHIPFDSALGLHVTFTLASHELSQSHYPYTNTCFIWPSHLETQKYSSFSSFSSISACLSSFLSASFAFPHSSYSSSFFFFLSLSFYSSSLEGHHSKFQTVSAIKAAT